MDKDKNGNRFDGAPIANGLIKAGATDIVNYDPENHDAFATLAMDYDGVVCVLRLSNFHRRASNRERKKSSIAFWTYQSKGKAGPLL